jgi:hypothetical protein
MTNDQLAELPAQMRKRWGQQDQGQPQDTGGELPDPATMNQPNRAINIRQIQQYMADLNQTGDDVNEYVKQEFGKQSLYELSPEDTHALAIQMAQMVKAQKGAA